MSGAIKSICNNGLATKPVRFFWFLPVWLMLFPWASVCLAQCEEYFKYTVLRAFREKRYDDIMAITHEMLDSLNCSERQKFNVYAFIGASYFNKGRWDSAKVSFQKCIRLDPGKGCPEGYLGEEPCDFFHFVESGSAVPLKITSTPEKATFFIDNDSAEAPLFEIDTAGTTDFTIDPVIAGELYNVRLTKECYKDTITQIKIEKGRTNSFHFEMQELLCPLAISSVPSGAIVHIDGSEKGTTAIMDSTLRTSVSCGDAHKVEISKKGYYAIVKPVQCFGSEPLAVSARLAKKPNLKACLVRSACAAVVPAAVAVAYYLAAEKDDERYMKSLTNSDMNKNRDRYEKNIKRANMWWGGTACAAVASATIYWFWPWRGKGDAHLDRPLGNQRKIEVGFLPRHDRLQLVVIKKF